MLIRTIFRKRRHILTVLYNMARAEVERSMHFMLKVVVADATGGALVAAVATVAAEEFVTADEAEVDMEVVVVGERNRILPPNHTLTSNGRLSDTKRRARYLLSTIKVNCERLMRSRYQNRESLILS